MSAERPTLRERIVDLCYGYRMWCQCGNVTEMTAVEYFEGANKTARFPCSTCKKDIHYGPAVLALRDPHDAALDDGSVPQLAWYHTSTWPDWPSSNRAREITEEYSNSDFLIPADVNEQLRQRALTQALHLGSYSTAIENIFRRMRDQGDRHAQFYLYRVKLASSVRLNEGYRDENHESAAEVTIADIRSIGLDAIRYLNVHEAKGELSLAVVPGSIEALQCLKIPVSVLPAPMADWLAPFLGRAAELDVRRIELEAGGDTFRQGDLRASNSVWCRTPLGLGINSSLSRKTATSSGVHLKVP